MVGPEEVEGGLGVHSRAWRGREGASPARAGRSEPGVQVGTWAGTEGPGAGAEVRGATLGKRTGAWQAAGVQGKGLRSREGSRESEGDPRGPLRPGSAGRGLGEEAQGRGWAPGAA